MLVCDVIPASVDMLLCVWYEFLCAACMRVCVCDLARSLDHLLFLAAGWQGSGPQWGAQARDQLT